MKGFGSRAFSLPTSITQAFPQEGFPSEESLFKGARLLLMTSSTLVLAVTFLFLSEGKVVVRRLLCLILFLIPGYDRVRNKW